MDVPVQIGEVLASKYRVERVLGAGGMGVVVAARHLQLGSLVALKFLLPEGLKSLVAVERFLREARAVARLRGEHVVRVTDVGTLETGAPYIVMEFLEGADLAEVLHARGALPIPEALGYVLDTCEAMDEAHQQGIVHRDIKPKNLFLTHRPNGTPLIKVLDFGISKVIDADDGAASTQTGSILGSPAFMAPEQLRNAKYVDGRADIYAIGVVLHYLLTKASPYDSQTVAELVGSVLYKEARPLRALRPDAPPALEAIVTRCLQKDPQARFSTVRELMAAIRGLTEPAPTKSFPELPSAVTRAAPIGPNPSIPDTLGHAAVSSRERTSTKGTRMHVVLLVGASLLGMFVIAAVSAFAYLSRSKTPVPAVASSLPSNESPSHLNLEIPTTALPPPERPDAGAVDMSPPSVPAAPPPAAPGSAIKPRSPKPAASAPPLRHGGLLDDGRPSP